MVVQKLSSAGYCLNYMDDSDLNSLREMIKGAGLQERRHWNRILGELNEVLK